MSHTPSEPSPLSHHEQVMHVGFIEQLHHHVPRDFTKHLGHAAQVIAQGGMLTTVETNVDAAALHQYVDSRSEVKQRIDAEKVRLLDAYGDFQPAIQTLCESVLQADNDTSSHPDFLGEGYHSQVYRLDRDDQSYAVRIAKPENMLTPVQVVDQHLKAALPGKEIPGFEQFVAASYEDGITVAKLLPGKEITRLSHLELTTIPVQHFEAIIDSIIVAHDRGIGLDPRCENFLYDPSAGFSVVDYHYRGEDSPLPLHETIQRFSDALRISARDRMAGPANGATYASMLKTYQNVLRTRLNEADFDQTRTWIDLDIRIFDPDITPTAKPARAGWLERLSHAAHRRKR